MVLISGLTLVLPPEQALAALILPTFLTNTWQALRQGVASAIETTVRFRVFLLCGLVLLVLSAQLVRVLDPRILYGLIGGPVALFAVMQLAGWRTQPFGAVFSGRSRSWQLCWVHRRFVGRLGAANCGVSDSD